jgi:hypothetical protein
MALNYGDGTLTIGLVVYLPGGAVYVYAGISFWPAAGPLNVAFLFGSAGRWLQRWLVGFIRREWVLLDQNGDNYNKWESSFTPALLININYNQNIYLGLISCAVVYLISTWVYLG